MSEDRSREDGRRPDREAELAREIPWYERWLTRLSPRARDSVRADIEDALAEKGDDAFTAQERAMLRNVLGFHRLRVEDAMVPRADIVAVPADTTLGELLGVFRTAGHSRLPVYGETLDDPRGMVHIRDFLDHLASRAEAGAHQGNGQGSGPSLGDVDLSLPLDSANILRPVLYVPGSMPAIDLLVRMQTTRTHMALVIDEYGGTEGIVSIEDLVEMVVGDIEDEHDEADADLIVRGEAGTLVADARAPLEEVSEALSLDLRLNLDEDVQTLGGLVVTLAGRVPVRGERLAGPNGLVFEVLEADPRRLKRVRIHRPGAGDPTGSGGPTGLPPGSPEFSGSVPLRAAPERRAGSA